MRRVISAGAVIFRRVDEKPCYLLLQYELGHWEFVKGGVEEKENTEATIRRETQEETGIADLSFIDGFKEHVKYIFTWPPKDPKAEKVFKIVTFLLAETKTSSVTLSYEHKGYIWLPYEEAYKKLTFKNAKEILKKADQFLREKSL